MNGNRELNDRFNGIFDNANILYHLFGEEDPFRLRIQKCLTAALKQIKKYDDEGALTGFEENVADGTVGRGRLVYEGSDPLPIISILEEPFSFEEDLAPALGEARQEPYELILQGFTDFDPQTVGGVVGSTKHPADPVHRLLADVKRRLSILKLDEERKRERVFRIGTEHNSVISLGFDGGVVRPAYETSPTAHFWLRVSFEVSEDHYRPRD